MKPYFLNSDINVLCVTASSFPDGIVAAFEKLNSLIQSPGPRRIFGISYGDGHKNITYKAAAEENSADEAARLGCESFTIKKRTFLQIAALEEKEKTIIVSAITKYPARTFGWENVP